VSAVASVGVVMRFRDSAATLPAVLDALFAQSRRPDLLIGVDTGSRDGSRALLERRGARIIDWTQPYHVSRVLNAGIAACPTDLVLVLSAHSVLSDPGTVARYVSAMDDPTCAGVSARPPGFEHFPERIDWAVACARGLTYCSCFSNSLGMLRRNRWERIPFDERLAVAAEDYTWALEQLRANQHVAMPTEPYRYLNRERPPHAARLRAVLAVGRRFGLPMRWLGVRASLLGVFVAAVRVAATLGISRTARDNFAKHCAHLWGWCTWRWCDPFAAPR